LAGPGCGNIPTLLFGIPESAYEITACGLVSHIKRN
jgi:hypothetical protein